MLNKCRFSDSDGVEIAHGLKDNIALKRVDLTHNELGEHAGEAMAKMIVGNVVLRELRLSENEIGDLAGAAIAEAVRSQRRNLRHTGHTRITGGRMTVHDKERRKQIEDAFNEETCGLRSLHLSGCGLGSRTLAFSLR